MARPVDIRRIVNDNIASYMKEYELTENDLAEIIGTSYSTAHRRYNVLDDGAFNLLQLQRFATKCKCTVADLVTPKESMSARDAEIDAMLKWWRTKGGKA